MSLALGSVDHLGIGTGCGRFRPTGSGLPLGFFRLSRDFLLLMITTVCMLDGFTHLWLIGLIWFNNYLFPLDF